MAVFSACVSWPFSQKYSIHGSLRVDLTPESAPLTVASNIVPDTFQLIKARAWDFSLSSEEYQFKI